MKIVLIGSLRWKIGTVIKDFGESRKIRALIDIGNAIKWGRR